MRFVVLLLVGAGIAGAASSVADSRSRLVTDAQVDTWLRTWQKRLHLDDWRIEARIVRSTELKPATVGNLKWDIAAHTAKIKVLSPIDYEMAQAGIPEDMEYTVVHELVHLQLSLLPRDLNKKDVEEAVVNRISDALMALDKGPSFHARSVPPPQSPGKPSESESAGRTSVLQ